MEMGCASAEEGGGWASGEWGGYHERYEEEVGAVSMSTQCHGCQGWGRSLRQPWRSPAARERTSTSSTSPPRAGPRLWVEVPCCVPHRLGCGQGCGQSVGREPDPAHRVPARAGPGNAERWSLPPREFPQARSTRRTFSRSPTTPGVAAPPGRMGAALVRRGESV